VIDADSNDLSAQADFSPDVTDIEMAWASLTFHCLAEGTSQIVVETAEDTLVLYDGQNPFPTIPDPFQVTCNQVEPSPVGGFVASVNKLQILAPYLALAAAVVVVSALVVQKKRRD